jgi:hypothetical protein
MDNLSALKSLCNAICSAFYPDRATLEMMLFNEGIDGEGTATPKDATLLRVAIRLVKGFVESSRSENGVSVAVDADKVDQNIAMWCSEYGIDADDYTTSMIVIDDGSSRW